MKTFTHFCGCFIYQPKSEQQYQNRNDDDDDDTTNLCRKRFNRNLFK